MPILSLLILCTVLLLLSCSDSKKMRPRARLAQSDDFIEMRILGIEQTAEELAILLFDLEDRLVFPCFVGFCQAASINATLNRRYREEASTHALFHELIVTAKATVATAASPMLRENTYIGAVSLVRGQRKIVLDTRPSDAVAPARGSRSPRTC